VITLERPCLSRAHVASQFFHDPCHRLVSEAFRRVHVPLTTPPPIYHNSLLTPLIWAVIFWASNGKVRVKFIDSLFICVSAVTGTGLVTLDLSSLTAWQQTILVILEIVGSPVTVSWFVVTFRRWGFAVTVTSSRSASLTTRRRHYFLKHLADVVNSNAKRKRDADVPEKGIQPNHHNQRSGKVAGVIKRFNPRSARPIQKAEDGESRSTSSPDCVSGMFYNPYPQLHMWSISRRGFQKQSGGRLPSFVGRTTRSSGNPVYSPELCKSSFRGSTKSFGAP